MLTSDDLYKLSNTWTAQLENNKSYLTDNRLTDWLHSAAAMSANFIGAELSNLKNLFTGDTNKAMNKASAFEMARYFNFNTEDADEITVSFVLFNTIVKNGIVDQWKRNLYFISLFNLRNLPFKLDYTTYLPPLLYDLIIPGVKRLPFCYVSSFGAVPQGLIRNMKINNFLSAIAGNDTNANSVISVPIPEAWTITITFKSMVARTANLMLAGGADLPITINMSASDAEKVDPTLKEYNEMVKKMEEEQKKVQEKLKLEEFEPIADDDLTDAFNKATAGDFDDNGDAEDDVDWDAAMEDDRKAKARAAEIAQQAYMDEQAKLKENEANELIKARSKNNPQYDKNNDLEVDMLQIEAKNLRNGKQPIVNPAPPGMYTLK